MRIDLLLGLLGLLAGAMGAPTAAVAQQDIGHKALGTLGLLAGARPSPGVYLSNRIVHYASNELVDRNGASVASGLDVNALADALGLGVILEVKPLAATWSASVGIPVIHTSVRSEHPLASIDRSGLADLFVEPVRLAWRLPRFDVVTAYSFYAPTGRFEPGGSGGVGRGHWTQQFSLGGTAYFDRRRALHLSALGGYELNHRKRGIDITRGDTVQVQGGIGAQLGRVLTAGLAGYALWQVRDDRGADLPPVLSGARDRAFGLGPELGFVIAPIRSQLTLRYTHDLAVRSRPLGQLFFASLSFAAWRPGPHRVTDRR